MPRDSAGNYSLPSGYLAETGQTILASQHNPPLEDIATALTGSLPRNGAAAMQAALPMGGFKITNLGAGTADTDAANVSQVNAALPTGVVLDYPGSTAPTGFLLCYGQAVSRTTYAALYAVIGTLYGAGDGSTTFNLPDCRGRVSAGADAMGGTAANRLTGKTNGVSGSLAAVGGSETHTLTTAQLAAHTHSATSTVTDPGHHHPYIGFGNSGTGTEADAPATSGTATNTSDATTGITVATTVSNAGGGAAHNNVQPTIIFNKIIKT